MPASSMNQPPFPAQGRPVKALLQDLVAAPIENNISVTGISSDSRVTEKGDLFLACRGLNTNGGLFIRDAVRAGAGAVAVDQDLMDGGLVPGPDERRLPVFPVRDLHEKSGLIAGRFYGEPAKKLNLVGVTGTNGKTSVTYWSAKVCSALAGKPAGLVGSLGYGRWPNLKAGINTTPDPVTLHGLFADFVEEDVDAAFMEVSSHALAQHRVAGVDFDVAVFTNLSRDHLDYHKTMQIYAEVKQKLFLFESLRAAVVNYDDKYGRKIIRRLPGNVQVISYGMANASGRAPATGHPVIRAELSTATDGKISLAVFSPWGNGNIQTELMGRFNASNLLAVIAVLRLSGFSLNEILEKTSAINSVPGRMEYFTSPDGARIVVDYAHSPDALEKVLTSLKEFCGGRLICVFGCGGNRDKAKRSRMGKLAEEFSDEIILTDDNPRDESPEEIISDILSGMDGDELTTIERNRSKAIELAIGKAGPGDVVLIAGKGHETCQEIAGVRRPFNDGRQVRQLLGNAA